LVPAKTELMSINTLTTVLILSAVLGSENKSIGSLFQYLQAKFKT
jgi:hypothetical protein